MAPPHGNRRNLFIINAWNGFEGVHRLGFLEKKKRADTETGEEDHKDRRRTQ